MVAHTALDLLVGLVLTRFLVDLDPSPAPIVDSGPVGSEPDTF